MTDQENSRFEMFLGVREFKNTEAARSRVSPECSSAAMVLAKVGAVALPAMAAIALRSAAKPLSKAGTKCSMRTRSNGGIWNGVVHAPSRGFCPGGRILISFALGLAGGADFLARALLPAALFLLVMWGSMGPLDGGSYGRLR